MSVGDGGKIEWQLTEVNTRAVSRGLIKCISEFKLETAALISIGVQDMKYTYIPTGIIGQLVRSGVGYDRK